MKKNRYLPFGYTVRHGRTVIDHDEAKIVQNIFDHYVNGASLKDIAKELTEMQIPYTEKTSVWDKARVARIIDNAKYVGDGEYDPIIDEHLYECAVASKTARQRGGLLKEREGIATLRNHIRCESCGFPMERKVCQKNKIKESWVCSNPICGIRVRMPDPVLLEKVNRSINHIIMNSALIVPKPDPKHKDSDTVAQYQRMINAEVQKPNPNEEYIVDILRNLASELYKETDIRATVTSQIAKRRVEQMKECDEFNPHYFNELIAYITLNQEGRITLHTKTETTIQEGEENGSKEDSQENSNRNGTQAITDCR